MKFTYSYLFFPLLLLMQGSLHAQPGEKELRLPEVGWTLHIPPGTKLNPAQVDSLFAVTKAKLGTMTFDQNGIHVLFAFFDPPYSAFAGSLSKFDTSGNISWLDRHQFVKNQLMQLVASLEPKVKVLDTASAVERVGGWTFQRFYLKTFYPENQVILQTYWYACRFRSYDLAINLSFADAAIGRQFLDILRHSTFEESNE